jgi:hypothetical protein
MTLQLSSQLESALFAEATRLGITPQLLAVQIIESQLPERRENKAAEAQTVYDFLKPHLDSLPEPPADLPKTNYSQDTGRRFAEGMAEKHRQGRL